MRQDDSADVGEAMIRVVPLELVVRGPDVRAQPGRAAAGGAGAGPVQEFRPERPVTVERGLGPFSLVHRSGLAQRSTVMVAAAMVRSQTMNVSPASMLRSIPSIMRSWDGQGFDH